MVTARQDVFLSGGQDAIVTPSRVISTAAVPAPAVSTPSTAVYPKVASVNTNSGEGVANSWRRYLGYGYNGIVVYRNTSQPTSWTAELADLATTHGNVALNMQLTCKAHSDSGLQSVLASLPNAWRAGFKYNYWQEPADDGLNNPTWQANYRATYTSAANVVRAWNAANPTRTVQLPWIELTGFDLELLYCGSGLKGVGSDTSRSPALYTPPTGDFGGVLWSFFEYNEKPTWFQFVNGQQTTTVIDGVDEKIRRLLQAMSTFFPGKPWGLMASAYTLEPASITPNYTTAQLTAQAQWMTDTYNKTRAAGSECFAWYDRFFNTGGNADGETRISALPTLMTAFQNLAP